jgi:cardiolipin synthase
MSSSVAPEALDRVVTLPNAISVIRLCCIPVFVWLLFGRSDREAAAWLLGTLGATDWVDGYLARRWHQVSTVGKVLDPTADRLLFIVGVSSLIIDGSAPVWFCWAVVIREVVLSIALLALTAAGMKRFDVNWYGKAGTFDLMIAFPAFLMGASSFRFHEPFRWLGWLAGIPGLVLSYYAVITYVPIMRRALRDGRAERSAHTPTVAPQEASR